MRFGGEPLACDTGDVSLTDLRFYVHDVRVVTADGDQVPLTLLADSLWQNGTVVLLDFENGEGRCTNGTQPVNRSVRGMAPAGEYVGLMFRIGVPEELNHQNPLVAEAPLNYSFMHWHWSTGYKFLRAGIANDLDGFWMHLGSSRCAGATGCGSANRPLIELPAHVPGRDIVVLDLLRLIEGVDLADGVPSDCSSGPAEAAACANPFAALGLDFTTGASGGGTGIFSSETR
jgi:uncharacterized repeat protein (TIGR04052 family)